MSTPRPYSEEWWLRLDVRNTLRKAVERNKKEMRDKYKHTPLQEAGKKAIETQKKAKKAATSAAIKEAEE